MKAKELKKTMDEKETVVIEEEIILESETNDELSNGKGEEE